MIFVEICDILLQIEIYNDFHDGEVQKMANFSVSSDKILEAYTENICVIIKSKTHPFINSQDTEVYPSLLDITAQNLTHIKIDACGIDTYYALPSKPHVQFDVTPLFFEDAYYEIIIKSNDSKSVSLWHENPDVRESISPITDSDTHIVSGMVSFKNSVGFSELEVFHDEKKVMTLRIEVFPSRIAYKEDYKLMLEEISREIYSEPFKKIISDIFDLYIDSAKAVIASPYNGGSPKYCIIAPYKVNVNVGKANRFMDAILNKTTLLLDKLNRYHILRGSDICSYITEIKQLASSPFFKKITENNAFAPTLDMPLCYHRFYKAYLALKRVLTMSGDIFKLSAGDTAQLYEYWCFIKLVSIIKGLDCQLISGDPIKAGSSGIEISLSKSNESEVKFINPKTGEEILLRYIPSPDNVITFEKHRNKTCRKYVLAPRYNFASRHNDNKAMSSHDINLMYKYKNLTSYRDDTDIKTETLGAYVLFAHDNEVKFSEQSPHNDTNAVVGSLPFLPGASEIIEKLTAEFIRDCEPKTIPLSEELEEALSAADFNSCNVLVGSLGSCEQFADNIAKKYYYVPERNFDISRLPIRYVAIYQSSRLFGEQAGIRYFGEVVKHRRIKRKKIKFPMRKNNGEEWYYLFKIREWKKLEDPIDIKHEGVYEPKYTNIFLLKNCTQSYELFNIRSAEQYRVLYEMKYILNSHQSNVTSLIEPLYRLTNGKLIWLHGDSFDILNKNGEKLSAVPFHISNLKARPKYYFSLISNESR